jgi:hypothetical protein
VPPQGPPYNGPNGFAANRYAPNAYGPSGYAPNGYAQNGFQAPMPAGKYGAGGNFQPAMGGGYEDQNLNRDQQYRLRIGFDAARPDGGSRYNPQSRSDGSNFGSNQDRR